MVATDVQPYVVDVCRRYTTSNIPTKALSLPPAISDSVLNWQSGAKRFVFVPYTPHGLCFRCRIVVRSIVVSWSIFRGTSIFRGASIFRGRNIVVSWSIFRCRIVVRAITTRYESFFRIRILLIERKNEYQIFYLV